MPNREIPDLSKYGLVADVGGTNVRFAAVDIHERKPDILSPRTYVARDYPNFAVAARTYLRQMNLVAPPEALVFAVAGPVNDNEIHLTNAGWSISANALQADLKAASARVVNDYEALAEAVPLLERDGLLAIGSGPAFHAHAEGTIAIIGPGTGLGVAGLVRTNGAGSTLVTEGGHAAFAPSDKLEIDILQVLMRKFGRVSAERILSGPGLLNLCDAMAEIDGRPPNDSTPEEITKAARDNPASFEGKVFARFCRILGSVAGDLALTLGARQGVLIAGGILPAVSELLAESGFPSRFEDKGRFAGYMKSIPTCLIVEKNAGLMGAASILVRSLPELPVRVTHAAR